MKKAKKTKFKLCYIWVFNRMQNIRISTNYTVAYVVRSPEIYNIAFLKTVLTQLWCFCELTGKTISYNYKFCCAYEVNFILWSNAGMFNAEHIFSEKPLHFSL